jgi:hypothetical protein
VAEIVRARLLRDVTTEKWSDRLCGIFAPLALLARAPNSANEGAAVSAHRLMVDLAFRLEMENQVIDPGIFLL